MRIAIAHADVGSAASRDERDALVQVEAVFRGLAELGHEPVAVPVSLNLAETARTLAAHRPDMVFNLVETLEGKGSLIHLFPALLDALNIPCTGADTGAMLLTSNKVWAKRWLEAAGLPTPPWFAAGENSEEPPTIAGAWLVKSVWEHASIGLDEDSVLGEASRERLLKEMDARREALGGDCLAEAYIDGREMNLSLLAGAEGGGPAVLPPAEIRFDAYPPGKVRVVGYRSKWMEESFEFHHTPRSFVFPATDSPLIAQLEALARACWRLFGLRGYARVDFRIDRENRPWILEVNANPCLSPDAGFQAAARQAGVPWTEVLDRILRDTTHFHPPR